MRTTISLSPKTKKRLQKHGKLGETHEDVLTKLIDFWEKKHDRK
jgi:hypothetical protein